MKSDRIWHPARVGDILKIRNGYAVKSSDYSQEGFPLIRQSDIDGDVIDITAAKRVSARVMEECEQYLVRKGDLLIGMSGSLGKIGRYVDEQVAIQNQRTGLLQLKPGFTAGFAKLVLKFVEPQIIAHGKGIAVQNVSAKEIENCIFPLPPEGERDHIVAEIEKQFTRLDAGVASLKRVQTALKRYRAGVLKAACEGRLVSINGEPVSPPELPEGWRWSNLKELKARSMYGPRFSSDDYAERGYLVLRTSDISEGGKVNTASAPRLPLVKEEAAKYRVERGDLLITRTGSLGTLAVFDDDVDAIPGAYLIHYRLAAPPITSKYIFYFLKSPNGQRALLKGGAGVGRPNLNAPTIESIAIPLPPIFVQEQIVTEVERRLSVIEELQAIVDANLQRAGRLRQAVLQNAFTDCLI